jgi:hypothetical protein
MRDLIKDRHRTYYAQKKVPERLQSAVARVLGNGKPRQVFLKKSLGTKEVDEANLAAKHVLAGFDRTLPASAAGGPREDHPDAARRSMHVKWKVSSTGNVGAPER